MAFRRRRIFNVGTNGKFVTDPLPVTKRKRLQPAPTCPAMPSRSCRAVHEIKSGRVHRLGVVDHRIDPRARIFLCTARAISARCCRGRAVCCRPRIALGRDTVPGEPVLETRDFAEQRAGGREVLHVLHYVGFRAHQFVRLAKIARTPVAHDFVHDGAGERVAGHAGKRIGAAALQRHAQRADRFLRAMQGVDRRKPAATRRSPSASPAASPPRRVRK